MGVALSNSILVGGAGGGAGAISGGASGVLSMNGNPNVSGVAAAGLLSPQMSLSSATGNILPPAAGLMANR